jgi:hypothetical protein
MASSLIARARRARPSAHPSSGALRAGPLPALALEPEPLTRRLRASQSLWTILWASCAKPVGILWITCGKPVDSRDPRHPPLWEKRPGPIHLHPPLSVTFPKMGPLGSHTPPPKKTGSHMAGGFPVVCFRHAQEESPARWSSAIQPDDAQSSVGSEVGVDGLESRQDCRGDWLQ